MLWGTVMEIPQGFAKVRAKEETDMDVRAYLKDYLAGYKHYKPYWNYEDGCVLLGCIDLYEATGDPLYRDFVLSLIHISGGGTPEPLGGPGGEPGNAPAAGGIRHQGEPECRG